MAAGADGVAFALVRRFLPWFDERAISGLAFGLARAAGAGMVASSLLGIFDTLLRHDFGASVGRHAVLALALQLGCGASLGLLVGFVELFVTRTAAWLSRHTALSALVYQLTLVALFVVAGSWSTAFWAFSGERVARTAVAGWGPPVLLLGLALASAGLVLGFAWMNRRARSDARVAPTLSVLVGVAATGLAYVDLSWMVSLYGRLHALLEAMVWLLLWSVASLWLSRLQALRPRASRGLLLGSLGGVLGSLAVWTSSSLGSVWSDGLAHTLSEELYAGRNLRRLEDAKASLLDPSGVLGLTSERLRLDKLLRRYDIVNTRLGRQWRAASSPTVPRITPKGPEARLPNVVVFYVDTLRYDAASDPLIMPRVARFMAQESLSFSRAYASGSDTVTSLGGITSGRYGRSPDRSGDLLRLAAQAGYASTLVVPSSAREYLTSKQLQFRFDETHEVRDYDEGKEVYGYGADQPTSHALVTKAIEELREPTAQPRLLWVFHYDQHNWRQFPDSYSDSLLAQYPQLGAARLERRYAAVARSIDREFERFEAALHEAGLEDDTILVFVSDHGEGLGRHGFFAHSIYLWEELVHVPLALRLPGVAPRHVDTPVSLVDLTPTLAPYLGFAPEYHGYDLQGTHELPRQRSILLAADAGGERLRIGVLDDRGRYKLVLPVDTAQPELYDLHAADADARNLARDKPLEIARLLETLVASPLFGR